MSDYLQDLVQNIYTKCDMSGFDDYNRGLKNLGKMDKQSVNERISLYEKEEKLKVRLRNYEDIYARKKRRRDLEDLSYMNKRNGLIRAGMHLLGAYLSIRTLQNIIQTGSKLQLIQKSIEGLTKSTQDWDFIQQQAFKTGTDIEVVARGYRNFYSSAKMAGFDTENIQGMYADLLLSTRAIGATTQQTEGALLALEQMISKGTVSMEELRRQLGNALPGAFEIGAKAMNMTTMEFNKFVRTGQLASAEFVPKFVAALKKEYSSGFKQITETVDFATKNLKNAWKVLTLELIKGEAGKSLAQGLNQLANILRSPEFIKFVRVLAKAFSLVVKILSYAIRHIGIIIVLLGAAGLTGALQRVIGLTLLLGRVLKVIYAGHVIKGIGILTKALFGLSLPVVLLYGKILAAIAALLLLEDIYTGLFHKEKESYTKDFINGVTKATPADYVRDEQTGYVDLKNRIKYGMPTRVTAETVKEREDFVNRMHQSGVEIRSTGGMYNPSRFFNLMPTPSTLPTTGGGVQLDKQEVNEKNVSMGDIHIHINGINDPVAVGNVVEEKIAMITLGQLGGVIEDYG